MSTSRFGATLALAFASASASCVEADTEGVDAPRESAFGAPIVGGEVDEGHPAVVALTYSRQAFCSGTLVTPTLVVTAAHCLQDDGNGIDAEDIEVFFGTETPGEGVYVRVIQAVPKPDWYLDDPNIDDDIGIVRLAEPGPATPIPMGDLPPIGTTLTMVGFGITSENGPGGGTKRVTTSTIVDRDAKIFFLERDPGAICSGDSGGTALAMVGGVETLVGVHTRGDCVEFSIDERVDAHTDFLAPYLAGARCDADGQCSVECEEPDPDCPCANDGLCTVACPDASTDADCPPGCGGPGNGCGQGCPEPDADCPICVQDGFCQIGCDLTPDPDCVVTTVGAVSSSSGGEGGGGDGAGGGQDAVTEPDEGCAVATPGEPVARGGLGLLAGVTVAMAAWARRRRRNRS